MCCAKTHAAQTLSRNPQVRLSGLGEAAFADVCRDTSCKVCWGHTCQGVLSKCGGALHVSWGAGIPAVPQVSWPHQQHWVLFLLWLCQPKLVCSFYCAGALALP